MIIHTLRGAILGLLLAVCLFGQFTTASLSGSLLDASGAAVPDAQVTVRNVDTGFNLTVKSDSVGWKVNSTGQVVGWSQAASGERACPFRTRRNRRA